MSGQNQASLIALDWGTSSLRAYLHDCAGTVITSRESADGVAAIASRAQTDAALPFRAAYEHLCGDWLGAVPKLPTIASGMIGSRQGWLEAPYLDCPADLRQLGEHLLRVDTLAGRPFAIVPGLKQTQPSNRADVMRGEETQLLGVLATQPTISAQHTAPNADQPNADQPSADVPYADVPYADAPNAKRATLYVMPGSHSKWVQLDGTQVKGFSTFMTGELYSAIAAHTIVGRLFAGGADRFDAAVFCAAVDDGAEHAEQLTAWLFSIRAAGLLGQIASQSLASRLSGLLIGAELAGARQRFGWFDQIHLIGSALLTERYRIALAHRGHRAVIHEADAAAKGLFLIAQQAGLLALS